MKLLKKLRFKGQSALISNGTCLRQESIDMEKYYCFASSLIGKNHLEKGSVLQDASLSYIDADCAIAVVSDGHGSENFPRSDRGSKFACAAAVEATREFISGIDEADLENINRIDACVEQLCKNILLRWNALVEEDAYNNPFSEDEVKKVKDKYRSDYLNGINMVHAYGATIILAVITPKFFLAIRNGDGECVIVNAEGELEAPIPDNEKNEASFVTSLCDEDAIDDFRYYFAKEIPFAVYMGSDGIENSYVTAEDLFALYRNISLSAINNGGDYTKKEVESALQVITNRGSGDDVSIAGIMNIYALCEIKQILLTASENRKQRIAFEKLERKRRSLEIAMQSLQKRLNHEITRRQEIQRQIQKLEQDHNSLISELKRLTFNQKKTEEDKAALEEMLPQIQQSIDALAEELRTINDNYSVVEEEIQKSCISSNDDEIEANSITQESTEKFTSKQDLELPEKQNTNELSGQEDTITVESTVSNSDTNSEEMEQSSKPV